MRRGRARDGQSRRNAPPEEPSSARERGQPSRDTRGALPRGGPTRPSGKAKGSSHSEWNFAALLSPESAYAVHQEFPYPGISDVWRGFLHISMLTVRRQLTEDDMVRRLPIIHCPQLRFRCNRLYLHQREPTSTRFWVLDVEFEPRSAQVINGVRARIASALEIRDHPPPYHLTIAKYDSQSKDSSSQLTARPVQLPSDQNNWLMSDRIVLYRSGEPYDNYTPFEHPAVDPSSQSGERANELFRQRHIIWSTSQDRTLEEGISNLSLHS